MLNSKSKEGKWISFLSNLLFCFFTYFLLILFLGYEIGIGDSAEFIGYSVNRTSPFLVKNDLFIKSMEAMAFNERWAYLSIVSLFSDYEDYFSLFFHATLTCILIFGLIKVISLYVENRYWTYFILLFSLVVFYSYGTGGNELYHIDLQSTTFSTAAGIWAIYFFLIKKKLPGILLAFISLFFQPLEGFHLILISGVAYVLSSYKTPEFKPSFIVFSAAFALAAIYAYVLLAQQKNNDSLLNPEEYFKTVFLFRFPHHFIPNYFSKIGIALNTALLVLGLVVFKDKSKFIFYFLLIIALGVLVYMLDLYSGMHLLTKSWWFRSTIWIRFLGITAFVLIIPKLAEVVPYFKNAFIIGVVGVIGVFLVEKGPDIKSNHYHFGDQYISNPEINICSKAKEILPENALVVHPINFTALSYYGKRASYVNLKTIPRSKKAISIWKERLSEVYGINTEKPYSVEEYNTAVENFYKIDLKALKRKGVTHVISYLDFPENGKGVVASNANYKIIEI